MSTKNHFYDKKPSSTEIFSIDYDLLALILEPIQYYNDENANPYLKYAKPYD